MPGYFKNHPIYYAGPAKTPEGMASGSLRTHDQPTGWILTWTSYQSLAVQMIMLAKGNRSKLVTDSCKKHGGFYSVLSEARGCILAAENIVSVKVVDFAELGMEAVRKIVVKICRLSS